MSNSGKNIMGQCKTKTYSALPVEDWVCDEVYPACKPLCYKGSFYITKIEGATGIPGKASTVNMYVGAFDSLDGDFLKAFNDCLGCCGEDTDTFMLGVDNGNGTATFTPADGSDPFTVSTMDTDTFVTIVDNGDGTATATNPDQTEVILSTVDTTVTYLFEQTNPVDGDGIIQFTVTPSDGGAEQFITLPEPTVDTDTNNDWTASALSPDGILTYTGTDGDGNPIAMPPVDLSALISPMLLAGTGISLDVDPNTGDITVNSTVVDTTIPDTFTTYNAVQTLNPDGSTTTTITVTPADGGPDVVTTITSGQPDRTHTDGTVVEDDCTQPSLNTCIEGEVVPAPKAMTVAPYERKVCGRLAAITVEQARPFIVNQGGSTISIEWKLMGQGGITVATQNITSLNPEIIPTISTLNNVGVGWFGASPLVPSTPLDYSINFSKDLTGLAKAMGCPTRVFSTAFEVRDLGTGCYVAEQGTNFQGGGDFLESPSGTFCPAPPATVAVALRTLQGLTDPDLLSEFVEVTALQVERVDRLGTIFQIIYNQPACVWVDCAGDFIRAEDVDGNSLTEAQVVY